MGHVKTMKVLTKLINNKFNTKFDCHNIQYRVNKLLRSTLGQPHEDAFKFFELAKEEIKKNKGGFFKIDIDQQNVFRRCLYVSDCMLEYAKQFLDIVIVDSTYKRNRFNLSLVNILGISNYGRNILLGFGLLSKEDIESYSWIFENLKRIWKKEPDNFITDECESIKQGIFLFVNINLRQVFKRI